MISTRKTSVYVLEERPDSVEFYEECRNLVRALERSVKIGTTRALKSPSRVTNIVMQYST